MVSVSIDGTIVKAKTESYLSGESMCTRSADHVPGNPRGVLDTPSTDQYPAWLWSWTNPPAGSPVVDQLVVSEYSLPPPKINELPPLGMAVSPWCRVLWAGRGGGYSLHQVCIIGLTKAGKPTVKSLHYKPQNECHVTVRVIAQGFNTGRLSFCFL